MRPEKLGTLRAVLLGAAVFFPALSAAAQDIMAPLPFPVRSHEEWFRMQYGASREEWTAKLGPDYVNRNSGPACVVMLLHYKKRAGIKSDFGDSIHDDFHRAAHVQRSEIHTRVH